MKRRHALRVAALLVMGYQSLRWWFKGAAPAELAGTAIIIALFVYEVWIQPRLKAWKRERELKKTFAINLDGPSEIQVGVTTIPVRISIGYSVEMGRFNFRFVANGRNASPDDINIQTMEDTSRQTPDGLVAWPDKKGGYYGTWASRPKHDVGEALRFLLHVNALRPWNGTLSFRSYDADNQRQVVRVPLKVVVN